MNYETVPRDLKSELLYDFFNDVRNGTTGTDMP